MMTFGAMGPHEHCPSNNAINEYNADVPTTLSLLHAAACHFWDDGPWTLVGVAFMEVRRQKSPSWN